MRPLPLAALVATLTLVATRADADLPPPDDQKFVGFAFSVRGLSAAPDRVLLAYPCGGSNGAPYRELAVLEEGKPVSVGRRGGNCLLYSMARSEYDAWAKTYTPKGDMDNAEADALIAKAIKCSGAPSLAFSIPKDDPRGSIDETLEVKTLSATSCVVASTSPPAPPPPQRGSCGRACAASGAARSGSTFGGLALGTLLACALRRRRRPR